MSNAIAGDSAFPSPGRIMETSSALFELASVSLACRDQDTLLKTFAARVGATLGARAVFVWIYDSESEGLVCRTHWTETGERIVPSNEPVTEGPLAIVFENQALPIQN